MRTARLGTVAILAAILVAAAAPAAAQFGITDFMRAPGWRPAGEAGSIDAGSIASQAAPDRGQPLAAPNRNGAAAPNAHGQGVNALIAQMQGTRGRPLPARGRRTNTHSQGINGLVSHLQNGRGRPLPAPRRNGNPAANTQGGMNPMLGIAAGIGLAMMPGGMCAASLAGTIAQMASAGTGRARDARQTGMRTGKRVLRAQRQMQRCKRAFDRRRPW